MHLIHGCVLYVDASYSWMCLVHGCILYTAKYDTFTMLPVSLNLFTFCLSVASILNSYDCSLLYPYSLKVCLVNDPRPNSHYGKLYTVKYLNNMVDGLPVLYINQPIDMLRQLAIKSLKSNEV